MTVILLYVITKLKGRKKLSLFIHNYKKTLQHGQWTLLGFYSIL